jgi:uncharacterized protein (DUF433 family)
MTIVSIDHIEIREGKPRITGTRIRVHDIANTYVHAKQSVEWIVENFEVTPAQIYAALSYYYDHQEQIDREIREGDELAREAGGDLLAIIRARSQKKQDTPDQE